MIFKIPLFLQLGLLYKRLELDNKIWLTREWSRYCTPLVGFRWHLIAPNVFCLLGFDL